MSCDFRFRAPRAFLGSSESAGDSRHPLTTILKIFLAGHLDVDFAPPGSTLLQRFKDAQRVGFEGNIEGVDGRLPGTATVYAALGASDRRAGLQRGVPTGVQPGRGLL